MNKFLCTLLGSSPRTTLLGLGGALLLLVPQFFKDGKVDWQSYLMAAIVVIGGRMVKDSDGINRKKAKKIVHRVLPETKSVRGVPKMENPPAPPLKN